jgi:hypothetical protein
VLSLDAVFPIERYEWIQSILRNDLHEILGTQSGEKSLSGDSIDNDAGDCADPTFESRGFPAGDASPSGIKSARE